MKEDLSGFIEEEDQEGGRDYYLFSDILDSNCALLWRSRRKRAPDLSLSGYTRLGVEGPHITYVINALSPV